MTKELKSLCADARQFEERRLREAKEVIAHNWSKRHTERFADLILEALEDAKAASYWLQVNGYA